jgi:serine phosphatase RsbU (regulator of sigma subunit)
VVRRQAQRSGPRPLPPEVLRRIDADPLFAVMTGDGQHWIDPYTGTAVPASLGRVTAAREYLTTSGAWIERDPLPLERIEYERWRFDLLRLLPVEPRLRLFGRDGRGWMNPFNGDFCPEIGHDEGKVTAHTLARMAERLARCPEARSGRMLDQPAIQARALALGLGSASRQATPGATSAVARPAALNQDLARAKSVQEHMLPDLPRLDGWDLGVHFTPQQVVSGDFYDVLPLRDGRTLFLIGDVSGHGMQAALVVATALKTLRFLARQLADPAHLLAQFNDEIKPDLLPGQFMTIAAVALDPLAGEAQLLRAGHHTALLMNLDRDDVLRRVGSARGMGIGLATGTRFSETLRSERIVLEPGDTLLLYTDGLIEAPAAAPAGAEGEQFGEHRLFGHALTVHGNGAQRLVDDLARVVDDWAGGAVGDDLTVLAIARLPEAEPEPAADAAAESG